jgi:hypothetical protein
VDVVPPPNIFPEGVVLDPEVDGCPNILDVPVPPPVVPPDGFPKVLLVVVDPDVLLF